MIDDDLYYELRLYEMVPGRHHGFHEMMRDRVPALFARHEIPAPLAIWEGYSGPSAPIYGYLLCWRTLDERMRAWGRLYSDSEFIDALTANYAGSARVRSANISLMKPSSVWKTFRSAGKDRIDGIYQVLWIDPTGSYRPSAEAAVTNELERMADAGGRILGAFRVVLGAPEPRMVTFVAWSDLAALTAYATRSVDHDPERPAIKESLLLRPSLYGAARENFGSMGAIP